VPARKLALATRSVPLGAAEPGELGIQGGDGLGRSFHQLLLGPCDGPCGRLRGALAEAPIPGMGGAAAGADAAQCVGGPIEQDRVSGQGSCPFGTTIDPVTTSHMQDKNARGAQILMEEWRWKGDGY
jgi:hypothetical protein